MRIDAYSKITQVYSNNKTKKTATTTSVAAGDKVEISRAGREYQIAKQAVNQADDVRMDKINEIKKRMEAGIYQVSSKDIADKVVNRYFDSIF